MAPKTKDSDPPVRPASYRTSAKASNEASAQASAKPKRPSTAYQVFMTEKNAENPDSKMNIKVCFWFSRRDPRRLAGAE